jgi:hypothetical protein
MERIRDMEEFRAEDIKISRVAILLQVKLKNESR